MNYSAKFGATWIYVQVRPAPSMEGSVVVARAYVHDQVQKRHWALPGPEFHGTTEAAALEAVRRVLCWQFGDQREPFQPGPDDDTLKGR
jgi:hypothetical protein